MTVKMDLTDFLKTRLAEDERFAKDALDEGATKRSIRYPYPDRLARCMHDARHSPVLVLREVEAKRRIVGWYSCDPGDMCSWHGPEYHQLFRAVLLALAAVYADHPDYDPEWSLARD